MSIAYIAIGSNLGDRRANCERAVERLVQDGVAENVIKSRWYETEPLMSSPRKRGSSLCNEIPAFAGMTGQNDNKYINGAVKIETKLAPRELLAGLQRIEADLGRVRTGKKWEPRTIDLDILFYDNLIIDTPELNIPHPELHKRMFVLEPLCDIEPTLLHPVLGKTISDIVRACREQ